MYILDLDLFLFIKKYAKPTFKNGLSVQNKLLICVIDIHNVVFLVWYHHSQNMDGQRKNGRINNNCLKVR